MDRNEILSKVQTVLRDIFDDEDINITENTVASDIDGWDSLAHLQVISGMEQEFHIKFTLGEINNFQNIGDMVTSICNHLNK